MKILMVTPMLPYPGALAGGMLVMHAQLVGLVARHQVTLATFAGEDPAEVKAVDDLRASGVNVVYIWRSWPSSVVWKRRFRNGIGWLRGGRPLRTLGFADPEMQRLLDQLLREQKFDLLQVEDNSMGNYCYRTQIPSVLTEHEVRYFPAGDREHRSTENWMRRRLSEAEQRRWQEYQPNVWRRFSRIQVFTPRDAATIGMIAPDVASRVRINPFGVDVPAEAHPNREQPDEVVFIGGFGHPPNVDAALWLCKEIMPRLRSLRPGIRLSIVGSYPTNAVRALARDDVIVTGRVPSVEPYLERAAVVLAPLRIGGGMRVKVLQAMGMGKAVVTTPLGAEGLTSDGEHPPLSIAETAEDIAVATARLLISCEDRHALGRRARAFVTERYSWSGYRERLEAVYQELQ
jgi:glycosyltransferase involved in cell wall biosynthesis